MSKAAFNIYAVSGKFLVPRTVRSMEGFELETEPVREARMSLSDLAELMAAAIADGNPAVGRTSPETWKKRPAVVVQAGFKSWTAFAREARVWLVEVDGSQAVLTPTRLDKDGQFRYLPDSAEVLSLRAGVGELARRLLNLTCSQDDV